MVLSYINVKKINSLAIITTSGVLLSSNKWQKCVKRVLPTIIIIFINKKSHQRCKGWPWPLKTLQKPLIFYNCLPDLFILYVFYIGTPKENFFSLPLNRVIEVSNVI